ncbi:MAG: NUDIX domain-containing protein [Candidatus Levybacteria bacterium]|nr:NUDIX domain-containing protein [Candidatus Levybacteria bacterium]
MITDKHELKLTVAVSTILVKEGKAFLVRRSNTGWEDGKYNLPGGHLNRGETARQAAAREVFEETGVRISIEDLHFFNVSHLITNSERVHIYFYAKKWEGKPTNFEKTKADSAGWFDLDNLPENLSDVFKDAISSYRKSITYSEFGWNR